MHFRIDRRGTDSQSIAARAVGDVNGTNVLTGLGVSNGVHRIQASSDLSPGSFFDLSPIVTADGAGLWQYQDAPAGLTKRFYRLAFP